MKMNRKNIFPLSTHESVCTCLSSSMFIITAIIALNRKQYLYSGTSALTSLISVYYWHNGVPGFRRNLDLFFSKISFSIYFFSGSYCVMYCDADYNDKYSGFIGLFGIVLCYTSSVIFWKLDEKCWVYFHMLFHLFSVYEQYLIITRLCYPTAITCR